MIVETPHGPAEVVLDLPDAGTHGPSGTEDRDHPPGRASTEAPRGLLVLGHGAGGGVEAPDLLAAAAAAPGFAVARVLQPYRVAGRKAPPRAPQLDEAWACVLAALTARFPAVPQIHGGRSSGARVACRGAVTAPEPPVGVLALAFPLLAPARKDGTRPDRSPEIDAVDDAGIPVLAVSGDRDRFGVPPAAAHREVVTVRGDHSLRAQGPVREAVAPWIARLVSAPAPGAPGTGPAPARRAGPRRSPGGGGR